VIRALIRFARLFPRELNRLHLQWARAHLTKHNPSHPDLPYVLSQLAKLEPK
jgi:hypothetical protein